MKRVMARRTRLAHSASRPARQPVTIVRPGINSLAPDIRKAALKAARGDVFRIEVKSPTEAIIR